MPGVEVLGSVITGKDLLGAASSVLGAPKTGGPSRADASSMGYASFESGPFNYGSGSASGFALPAWVWLAALGFGGYWLWKR